MVPDKQDHRIYSDHWLAPDTIAPRCRDLHWKRCGRLTGLARLHRRTPHAADLCRATTPPARLLLVLPLQVQPCRGHW
jgi:hypothetical protein